MSLKRLTGLTLIVVLALLATVEVDGQRRFRIRLPRRGSGTPGSVTDVWTVDSPGLITRGIYLPVGAIPSGQGVTAVGADTAQWDCQATWSADSSCRHGFVTWNATSTGAKSLTVGSYTAVPFTPTWPTASFSFAISAGPGSGSTYTATLPSFTSTNCPLNGAIARRCWVTVTPQTSGAVTHQNLTVKFEVTSYAAGGHRVGFGLWNIRQNSTSNQVTVTTSASVNGSAVTTDEDGAKIAQSNWIFHTGQGWYRTVLTSGLSLGTVHKDYASEIDAKILPRFANDSIASQTYGRSCANFTDFGGGRMDDGAGNCNYSYGMGAIAVDQPTSENVSRDELPPWEDWTARYILTGDNTYRLVGIGTAKQSMGWGNGIDGNGDGESLFKLTAGNVGVNTSIYSAGLGWQTSVDGCVYAGTIHGGCSESVAVAGIQTTVERAHVPESTFFVYIENGDVWYLDALRRQASWAVFFSYNGATSGRDQIDPYIWAGYYRGRGGTQGELNDSEMGREFGRPLRVITRAALAMPDSYSSDRDYFKTIAANNFAAVATYIDYLDSRTDINGRSWGGSPYLAVGMQPATHASNSWNRVRTNSVTATTNNGDGTTTLTVIGDDDPSGGTGVNDHGMLTGDYVDLSGFTTSGATALNGLHRAITKISATQFKVSVTTTANTTSEGTWATETGNYFALWRVAITGWEVGWACGTGFWTCSASTQAFPDRLALAELTLQTCTNFSTGSWPGRLHNFYPIPGHVRGDNYDLYTTCNAWDTANALGGASSALFYSEAWYAANMATQLSAGYALTADHRGNDQYNVTTSNDYYTIYLVPIMSLACDRGISGACAGYTTLVNANGVLGTGLRQRPGFYWDDTW